jgi:hypothetical protein
MLLRLLTFRLDITTQRQFSAFDVGERGRGQAQAKPSPGI